MSPSLYLSAREAVSSNPDLARHAIKCSPHHSKSSGFRDRFRISGMGIHRYKGVGILHDLIFFRYPIFIFSNTEKSQSYRTSIECLAINDTPAKWRFADGPLMARLYRYLSPYQPEKKNK